MKEILIINGSAGVGKDTFVECLNKFVSVYHTSIVNPVKKLPNSLDGTDKKQKRTGNSCPI